MRWQEARRNYPEQWLLIEAVRARTDADRRVVEEVAVVGAYGDSVAALAEYRHLHGEAPTRELYVFHTSREELEITERRWLGIRQVWQ